MGDKIFLYGLATAEKCLPVENGKFKAFWEGAACGKKIRTLIPDDLHLPRMVGEIHFGNLHEGAWLGEDPKKPGFDLAPSAEDGERVVMEFMRDAAADEDNFYLLVLFGKHYWDTVWPDLQPKLEANWIVSERQTRRLTRGKPGTEGVHVDVSKTFNIGFRDRAEGSITNAIIGYSVHPRNWPEVVDGESSLDYYLRVEEWEKSRHHKVLGNLHGIALISKSSYPAPLPQAVAA